MIYVCPGCGEFEADWCGYCDTCSQRSDIPEPPTIRLSVAGLICAPPAQRDYLHRLLKSMKREELDELVWMLFERSSPVERTVLLQSAAEIHGAPLFRDGDRPCR